jgi:hypothetical protein
MQSRLDIKEAFEKWNLVYDTGFELIKTSEKIRDALDLFIKYFKERNSNHNNYKGLLILPPSNNDRIDQFNKASTVCKYLYNDIKTFINVVHCVNHFVEMGRFTDHAESLLELTVSKIRASDLTVFNEIAPIELTENHRLMLSYYMSYCIQNNKFFIATTSCSSNKIAKNLGEVLNSLIMSHCIIVSM